MHRVHKRITTNKQQGCKPPQHETKHGALLRSGMNRRGREKVPGNDGGCRRLPCKVALFAAARPGGLSLNPRAWGRHPKKKKTDAMQVAPVSKWDLCLSGSSLTCVQARV
jgi:hypothetical protein